MQCSWGNELVILDIKQSFLNWVSRIRNGIQFRRLEVKSKRNILESAVFIFLMCKCLFERLFCIVKKPFCVLASNFFLES